MSELVKFRFYETALQANRDKQILAESGINSFEIDGVSPALIEGARQATAGIIRAVTGSVAYGDRNVAPWLVDLVDAMIRVNAVDALTDFVDTLGSHNRIAALPALATCEVLVLAGDSDKVIPVSHSERIAAELPEAELVVLPGVGHLPMLEQPVATDEALTRLVRRAAFRTRPRRVRRRA